MDKCKKCGQPIVNRRKKTDYIKFCLDGYDGTKELCNGCNATESVIKRLKEGKNISINDLKKLPSVLIFDPNDNDAQELAYGYQFQKIVKNLAACYGAQK